MVKTEEMDLALLITQTYNAQYESIVFQGFADERRRRICYPVMRQQVTFKATPSHGKSLQGAGTPQP